MKTKRAESRLGLICTKGFVSSRPSDFLTARNPAAGKSLLLPKQKKRFSLMYEFILAKEKLNLICLRVQNISLHQEKLFCLPVADLSLRLVGSRDTSMCFCRGLWPLQDSEEKKNLLLNFFAPPFMKERKRLVLPPSRQFNLVIRLKYEAGKKRKTVLMMPIYFPSIEF